MTGDPASWTWAIASDAATADLSGFAGAKTTFDALTTATATFDGALFTVGNTYTISGTTDDSANGGSHTLTPVDVVAAACCSEASHIFDSS